MKELEVDKATTEGIWNLRLKYFNIWKSQWQQATFDISLSKCFFYPMILQSMIKALLTSSSTFQKPNSTSRFVSKASCFIRGMFQRTYQHWFPGDPLAIAWAKNWQTFHHRLVGTSKGCHCHSSLHPITGKKKEKKTQRWSQKWKQSS